MSCAARYPSSETKSGFSPTEYFGNRAWYLSTAVDLLVGSGTTCVTITPSATFGPMPISSSASACAPTNETLLKIISECSALTFSMNLAAAL